MIAAARVDVPVAAGWNPRPWLSASWCIRPVVLPPRRGEIKVKCDSQLETSRRGGTEWVRKHRRMDPTCHNHIAVLRLSCGGVVQGMVGLEAKNRARGSRATRGEERRISSKECLRSLPTKMGDISVGRAAATWDEGRFAAGRSDSAAQCPRDELSHPRRPQHFIRLLRATAAMASVHENGARASAKDKYGNAEMRQ